MSEIVSRGQLRMALLRWALVLVPLVLLLGLASGVLSGSTGDDPWYSRLAKPSWNPPPVAFAITWPVLYALIGFALALVVAARRARGRGLAIALFGVQLALNLAWSPLFFGARQVTLAAWLLPVVLIAAIATTFAFGRVRRMAAWLMLPYLAWLGFACLLAFAIDARNPAGERLAPHAHRTHISGS